MKRLVIFLLLLACALCAVAQTQVTLTASSPVALAGALVSFTATVSGTPSSTMPTSIIPTGTVTFEDGTTPIGDATLHTNLGLATGTFFHCEPRRRFASDHRALLRRRQLQSRGLGRHHHRHRGLVDNPQRHHTHPHPGTIRQSHLHRCRRHWSQHRSRLWLRPSALDLHHLLLQSPRPSPATARPSLTISHDRHNDSLHPFRLTISIRRLASKEPRPRVVSLPVFSSGIAPAPPSQQCAHCGADAGPAPRRPHRPHRLQQRERPRRPPPPPPRPGTQAFEVITSVSANQSDHRPGHLDHRDRPAGVFNHFTF